MTRDYDEHDDAHWELDRRLERDHERESGAFRRRRVDFLVPGIVSACVSSRVVRTTKRGDRYEAASIETRRGSLSLHVVQTTKRAVNNSAIVDGKKPSPSVVGSSQRCAILRREA